MADNIDIDPGENPSVPVATDEGSDGKHYQKAKLFDPTPHSIEGIGIESNPQRVIPSAAATASENIVTVNNTPGGTQIIAANPNRKGGEVRVSINASQSVRLARAASAGGASRLYAPGEKLPLVENGVRYTGPVFGFVSSGTEEVESTEL